MTRGWLKSHPGGREVSRQIGTEVHVRIGHRTGIHTTESADPRNRKLPTRNPSTHPKAQIREKGVLENQRERPIGEFLALSLSWHAWHSTRGNLQLQLQLQPHQHLHPPLVFFLLLLILSQCRTPTQQFFLHHTWHMHVLAHRRSIHVSHT